ncbi:MAG: helix-turn-helix transcriptional regulator [Deltaproteobacteria bacterium]|nr:helix-turn-helix transcriptional regulator [Deltaproteobacteria bacterium]
MNIIRHLRTQTGLSQQELARIAGTSQPAIAQYEAGLKSPTLSTVQRLVLSLGLELFVIFAPVMTREDRRSLAYHREIAKMLGQTADQVVTKARRNLSKLKQQHQDAIKLFDRWQTWLNLPAEELAAKILDPGMMAREMRQVTPFAGLIKAKDRVKILKNFKKENNDL